MKQAWNDLKSFITVAMVIMLFVIVIANLCGATLADNILILITNLTTAVFTFYFTKRQEEKNNIEKNNIEKNNIENNNKEGK